MTPLADRLIRRIGATGPVGIAEYMTECLFDPEHGYYATRDPLGVRGDFITAPEVSQMFGECLGLALAQAWLDRGAPSPFALTELGPGRGTLMADMVRATHGVPGFHDAMQVHLIEASTPLKTVQAETLSRTGATWHESLADLADLPLFLVANEFFDALPIRQFLRDGDGWRERVVGVQNNALAFGLTEAVPVAALNDRVEETREGDLVELGLPAQSIATEIGRRIAVSGGVALIIDYGTWGGTGDTLQAVQGHRKTGPLEAPGEADLTAHVDFGALAAAATGADTAPLTPQGVFLERLGITARAQTLARSLSGPALEAHIAAHRRLTHPDEMGSLFQALALHAPGTPTPPGFAA